MSLAETPEMKALAESLTKRSPIDPGIYPGMSWPDYADIDAINCTILKLFRRSAAHARSMMVSPPEPTEALEFGSAYHVALLEPETFSDRYVAAPSQYKRSKAEKEAWAAMELEHPRATVLRPSEMETIDAMREVAYRHEFVGELLRAKGPTEVVAVAEINGTMVKTRMDKICVWHNWTCVIDLKTARDADMDEFRKASARFGYHVSAAGYIEVLNALEKRERRLLHIAQEKTPPFACAIYELDDEAMKQGKREFLTYLERYAEADASGVWPGYPVGIEPLSLPPWATAREEYSW